MGRGNKTPGRKAAAKRRTPEESAEVIARKMRGAKRLMVVTGVFALVAMAGLALR